MDEVLYQLSAGIAQIQLDFTKAIDKYVAAATDKINCDLELKRVEAKNVILEARAAAETKISEMRNLLNASTQLGVLKSEHTGANLHENVICLTCTENAHCLRSQLQLKSKWIASNKGVNQDSYLVQYFNTHINEGISAAASGELCA